MAKERSSKQPSLHWPAVAWMLGHPLIVVALVVRFVWAIKQPFYMLQPWLKTSTVAGFLLYAIFYIAAATALYKRRKSSFVLVMIALVVSTIYAYVLLGGRIDISSYSLYLWGIAFISNFVWAVYFVIFRHRYGIAVKSGDTPEKQPLHWPGIVWVVGNFALSAYLLYLFIGRVIYPLDSGMAMTLEVLRLVFVLACAGSSVMLLVNRRIGYLLVFITLGISFAYFAFNMVYGILTPHRSSGIMWLIYAGVVNVAWLVYFIKARRRYGVVTHG